MAAVTMADVPLYIPVILGTSRQSHQSEFGLKEIHSQSSWTMWVSAGPFGSAHGVCCCINSARQE